MKTSTLLLLLCAIFVTTLFVTAFAYALFSLNHPGAGFLRRFFRTGLTYGFINGVLVALIFWLIQKQK
jgi:hypothetical protein